jgi:hypothetical protein
MKITCSECKKTFSRKRIARSGKGWAYCRSCFNAWVKAKTGHDELDRGWANAAGEAYTALQRNKRAIESASPAGTRSQKPSTYRVGGTPSRSKAKF